MDESGTSERRGSSAGSSTGDAMAPTATVVTTSATSAATPTPVLATPATIPNAPPTASDLFTRQVDLQKIDFLNGRVLHLQAENEALRERHDKREQETHEFVAYFQKEILTRDKQITRLTEELAALKLSHALEMEASQQTKESECQQLTQHFTAKEEAFTEQLFFLKEELNQLEAFKEMKDTIHDKMKDVESQLTTEQQSAKEQIGALERKFLEEKARLQKEHEKRIEIVKQQAKEDARNGLDADTRKIVTDNRRMGEELRFQLQMTDELQKEKELLEGKAKKYYMEMQISKAKEEEYAAAAQRQAREIRQLRATITDLERRMSESLAEMEKDSFVAQHKSGKELEEMTLDVDGLRRLVRLKNKELRNLRKLAQMVLDQRTDVEVFFLDALEFVRQEIENQARREREIEMERFHIEMKKAGVRNASPLLRFPKLTSPTPSASPTSTAAYISGPTSGKHFSDKIDIRQLTWEDKERVLRLVFAKINGVQSFADATPTSPPSLPAAAPTETSSAASLSSSVGRRRSASQTQNQNQELSTSGPAVYFATEPTAATAPLSMSLSGLHVHPQPPPSATKKRK